MSELRDDLRFAARLLRKSPGFTAVALLTLALAIGANTALFSVVSGVLLRPFPFLEPERLFLVVRRTPDDSFTAASVPQYAFLSEQDRPFSQVTAWQYKTSGFNLSGETFSERVPGKRVTWPFFEVLGVPLALGRGFLPEEDVPGGPRVVVVGHGFWQRRFGGRPDILGRSLILDGEPHTIIGVAPPAFAYPDQAQLWAPLQPGLTSTQDTHYLAVVDRLKPDMDPAQVGSLLKAQSEQLRALRSTALRPGFRLDAIELQRSMTEEVRPALLVLLGAVGLVLLIACVNLANLQLARATARERDVAPLAAAVLAGGLGGDGGDGVSTPREFTPRASGAPSEHPAPKRLSDNSRAPLARPRCGGSRMPSTRTGRGRPALMRGRGLRCRGRFVQAR